MHQQENPVCRKKPVSNQTSILLGELVAILMTLHYLSTEIQKSQPLLDIHIFSDRHSAIGILKLGWHPTQHKHTVAEIKQQIQHLEKRKHSSEYFLDTWTC